ncbi:hypothetical protein F4861DRAFT_171596 [Xylaria intraflava]|nr:hypothetical protein F4861DRAFT_171596 [Xylaria intraflava]
MSGQQVPAPTPRSDSVTKSRKSLLPDASKAGLPAKPPTSLSNMNPVDFHPPGVRNNSHGKKRKNLHTSDATFDSLPKSLGPAPYKRTKHDGNGRNERQNNVAQADQGNPISNKNIASDDRTGYNTYNSKTNSGNQGQNQYDFGTNSGHHGHAQYSFNPSSDHNSHNQYNFSVNNNSANNNSSRNNDNSKHSGPNKAPQAPQKQSSDALIRRELCTIRKKVVAGKTTLTAWDQKYVTCYLKKDLDGVTSWMIGPISKKITNKADYLTQEIARWAQRNGHSDLLEGAIAEALFNFDVEAAFDEALMSISEVSELMDF